jgi:hypothetical protein
VTGAYHPGARAGSCVGLFCGLEMFSVNCIAFDNLKTTTFIKFYGITRTVTVSSQSRFCHACGFLCLKAAAN